MSSNYGAERQLTTVLEKDSNQKKQCPQCFNISVPRGITSTRPGMSGGAESCGICGHVYGRDSLLDGRVTGVKVTSEGNATTITADKGTLQLQAEVTPRHASDKRVEWMVTKTDGSATTAATVDANGLLKAVANGTVRVTAKALEPYHVFGYLVVTISNQA